MPLSACSDALPAASCPQLAALGDLRSVLQLAPQDVAEKILRDTLRRDEGLSG